MDQPIKGEVRLDNLALSMAPADYLNHFEAELYKAGWPKEEKA